MDAHSKIKKAFKRDIGKTAVSVSNCLNQIYGINNVYRIETDGKSYIFKMFHSAGYPEKGKMCFVSKLLSEHNIPHAKVYSCKSSSDDFPNGYMIEEWLPGITADKLEFTEREACHFYKKLAEYTSEVHGIKFNEYGFFINGQPDCATFSEHLSSNFIYGARKAKDIYTNIELDSIKKKLLEALKPCDSIQPCLCHVDLQPKNTLVVDDCITLIDWDDARSFPAIIDIARLTLLIELAYDSVVTEDIEKANNYKNAFLNNYPFKSRLSLYHELEPALHVWHGLVILNFCMGDIQHISKIKTAIDDKLKLMVKY